MKQKVVVVCPGRGTYNKDELGYLQRYHGNKVAMLAKIDNHRTKVNQTSVTQLDGMSQYHLKQHTAGENASSLIYACALGDFYDIDREKYDIVAVTGNSMGWYIALRCAAVLSEEHAINVINTMGSMMQNGLIGGQVIYPVIDENWLFDEKKSAHLTQTVRSIQTRAGCELYLSIDMGGYKVIGGNELALGLLENQLHRVQDRFPMRLYNHGAFHTPLLQRVAEEAKRLLPTSLFAQSTTALIDGAGKIWSPHSFALAAIHDYTLGAQVLQPYYFNRAIEVALKEFAPDKIIVLGPSAALGASIAHTLIQLKWDGIADKAAFLARQASDPYVLSMGRKEEREWVVR